MRGRSARLGGVLMLLASLLGSLALASCASSSTQRAASSPASSASASASSSQESGYTPVPDTISLTTERNTYAPSDTIVVLIHNRLPSAIYAYDHNTGCTVITLQRREGDSWQTEGGCSMGRATRLITIPASQVTRVEIAPGAGQMQSRPWTTGTYQAVLSYVATANGSGDAVRLTTLLFSVE